MSEVRHTHTSLYRRYTDPDLHDRMGPYKVRTYIKDIITSSHKLIPLAKYERYLISHTYGYDLLTCIGTLINEFCVQDILKYMPILCDDTLSGTFSSFIDNKDHLDVILKYERGNDVDDLAGILMKYSTEMILIVANEMNKSYNDIKEYIN